MSLRDTILSIDDLGKETLVIPEWNATIEIRGMTAYARAKMMEVGRLESEIDSRWHLISTSVYDPETKALLFQASDKDAVMGKSATAIDSILKVIYRINGYNEAAVEDAEKNS